ncbi:zinc finger domain-containing protein [Micromonospora zhanjiangensis]|uniref:DNA-binding phage zinc finger domain-containing protein n=1 Tax=Micromonospora zhanjiangensis TaxID=1522057 RepID=A0ABV8KP33_9ACTN
MSPADVELALTVPCPLCKMPAGSGCVNTVDVLPREPHECRPVRARFVMEAIAYNLEESE